MLVRSPPRPFWIATLAVLGVVVNFGVGAAAITARCNLFRLSDWDYLATLVVPFYWIGKLAFSGDC